MAIAFDTSVAANSSTNVASLALPSISLTSGEKVAICVALGSTGSSISSITDSNSRLGSITSRVTVNGTGVRCEIWTASVTSTGATVITLNITGGNTTIAAVCGEYSSISSFGNTQSATGNDQFPVGTVATQDANNFVLSAQAIACSSGDTFTAIDGTNRNSSVPAATAVGCALADKSSIAQATLKVTEQVTQGARQWATASVEARLAAGNDTVGALPSKSPNTEISPNVQMIQMNAVSNPNSGYTA